MTELLLRWFVRAKTGEARHSAVGRLAGTVGILCNCLLFALKLLAGLLSGAVYLLFKRKNAYVAMLLAAIVCPVVNTGTFVTCMLLFFNEVLSVWAGGSNIAGYILTGLILANFVPELAINVIFSPAGQRIADVVKKN